MNFHVIDPVNLCKEENAKLSQIMASGNTILKQSYENSSGFNNRSDFRKTLFNSLKGWNNETVRMGGALIWSSDIKKINEVRKHEYRILQGVSKYLLELSKKWNGRTGFTVEENYSEAVATAINCVYCYSDPSVKFCTYVGNAVTNEFIGLQRCNKPTSHWTNTANKLYGDYEKFRQLAEQALDKDGNPRGALTFDEIVKMMKLTPKEIKILEGIHCGAVINHSEMSGSEEDSVVDYTANRTNIDNARYSVDIDELELIKEVEEELDDWERAVWKAFLDAPMDDCSWKNRVANENINPNTNKNYSRVAPGLAFDRIKDKIKRKFGNVA